MGIDAQRKSWVVFLTGLFLACMASADGGITFEDIAQDPTQGLAYERTPSATSAVLDAWKLEGVQTLDDLERAPLKSRGAPGVAVADFDGDGDLDIYVTNGPGTPNSLFSNQLAETGELSFIDLGASSGAGAIDQDATGVCFGDIDNDGDTDLYVLGNAEPNRLFENQGTGSFVDITATAGVGGGSLTTTSCSFGDIDNDGLLDLAVANSWPWTSPLGLFVPFGLTEHNQLFHNLGANLFADVSVSSGIQQNAGFPPPFADESALTWAISMVDMDQDGDIDILMADDQGSVPFTAQGGVDRGFFHLFENDGTGQFVDVAPAKGLAAPGGWMGLDFGDFNCDGHLDFFASNFSDLTALTQTGGNTPTGVFPSRWILNNGDGTYSFPPIGDLVATPFGWGSSVFDYDADGDLDVIYHGGMDLVFFVDGGNAGTILQNQGCSATFVRDTTALAGGTDHQRRNVQGVAIGDLDGNGFDDVISVSSFDTPPFAPILPVPNNPSTVFADAGFVPTFAPGPEPGTFIFTGLQFDNGTLAVELNSGNRNRTLQVELVGTVGLATGSQSNRDGIGAIITSIPLGRGAPAATSRPVVGGSSYASQHSLRTTFGLGSARRAVIDVLWPGGTRNVIFSARAGRDLTVVEIPCSDDAPVSLREHLTCVRQALDELESAGVISKRDHIRRLVSAIRAWKVLH